MRNRAGTKSKVIRYVTPKNQFDDLQLQTRNRLSQQQSTITSDYTYGSAAGAINMTTNTYTLRVCFLKGSFMNRVTSSLLFFWALLQTSSTFAECLYCDKWRAFDGNAYFPGSIAEITESRITFPSCSPSEYEIVRKVPSKQFGPICTDHYFRLRSTPTCSRIPVSQLKPIVLVVACPRTPPGNEELRISLLQDSNDHAEYAPHFYGASWRLIRKEYDPCSSGGGHGQWMCARFALERAEQRLEALTSTEYISALQKWKVLRDRECKKKGNGFSESWAYREEETCKLSLTETRIDTIKQRLKNR